LSKKTQKTLWVGVLKKPRFFEPWN